MLNLLEENGLLRCQQETLLLNSKPNFGGVISPFLEEKKLIETSDSHSHVLVTHPNIVKGSDFNPIHE